MNHIKCLVPMCIADLRVRGLCVKHYSTARKLVSAGRTTWRDLEKAGKSEPQRSSARGPGDASNWFMEAEQAGPAK